MGYALAAIGIILIGSLTASLPQLRRYARSRPEKAHQLSEAVSTMSLPLGKAAIVLIGICLLWPVIATLSAVLVPIIAMGLMAYIYLQYDKPTDKKEDSDDD